MIDCISKFSLLQVTLDSRLQKMQCKYLYAIVDQTRSGNMDNEKTIREVCSMLMVVGMGSRTVYEDIFESKFLQTSAHYYSVSLKKLVQ